jgi:hypothetical protein
VSAEWASALRTVGAWGVALVLLGFTVVDRRQGREQQRRAQAARVCAWTEPERDHHGVVSGYRLYIRNASEEPVYNVVALIRDGGSGESLATRAFQTMPPNGDRDVDISNVQPPHTWVEVLRSCSISQTTPGFAGAETSNKGR